jgi:hypothetical protein
MVRARPLNLRFSNHFWYLLGGLDQLKTLSGDESILRALPLTGFVVPLLQFCGVSKDEILCDPSISGATSSF